MTEHGIGHDDHPALHSSGGGGPAGAGVPSTHWAYKRIEYAISQSVVQGYDDGLYHPEIAVTRDQMAVYIARAFDLAG